MGTKTFSKKLIAFVSAVVMSASLAVYVPFSSFNLSTSLNVSAVNEGNGGTSGNDNGYSQDSTATSGVCVNGSNTGLRIYFAKNSIYRSK